MNKKTAQQFLDLLGHRADLARVERLEDPDRRNHWLYRASHPGVGHHDARDEARAWHGLCDLAESQGALPDLCQATTRGGKPCRNAPQRGQRFCGAHLADDGATATPSPAASGLCQARTRKGRPCQNAPQAGEAYCGPHLDQRRRNATT